MNRRKSGETAGNSLKCGLCPKEKTFSTRTELRDHIAVKHLRIQQSGALNWYVDHLLDSMEAALMDDDSTLIESLTLEEQCDTPSTRSRTTKTAKLISSASSSSSDSESDVPVSPPKKKKTPEKPRSSSKSVLAPPLPLPQTTVVCKLCRQSMSSDFLTRRCHVSEIHMRSGEAQSDDDYLEVLAGKVKKAFPDMEMYNEKQCELCFKECNSVTTRRSHVLSEHCPPPMVCPVNNCGHDFGEVAKAEKHIATNHGISHTAANIKSKWSEDKKRFNLQVSAQVERCFRVPLGNKLAPAVTSSRVVSDDVVVRDVRAAAAQEFRRPVRQIEASEEDDSDDDEEEGGVANEGGDSESEMEESTDERGPTGDISIPIQQPQTANDDVREKVVKEEVVSPEKSAPVQDRTVSSGGGKDPKGKEGVQQSVVKREPREEEESMVSVPLPTRKRRREESEQEETSQSSKRKKSGTEAGEEYGAGAEGAVEKQEEDVHVAEGYLHCRKCQRDVKRTDAMVHLALTHGYSRTCPIGGCMRKEKFTSSTALKSHIRFYHRQFDAEQFSIDFSILLDSKLKEDMGSKDRDCGVCGETFPGFRYYLHSFAHADVSARKCVLCDYVSTNGKELRTHIESTHACATHSDSLLLLDQVTALSDLHLRCFPAAESRALYFAPLDSIAGIGKTASRADTDRVLRRAGLVPAMRWDESRKVLTRIGLSNTNPCKNSHIVFSDDDETEQEGAKEEPMDSSDSVHRPRSTSLCSSTSRPGADVDNKSITRTHIGGLLQLNCIECNVFITSKIKAHDHLSRVHGLAQQCPVDGCRLLLYSPRQMSTHSTSEHKSSRHICKRATAEFGSTLDSAMVKYFGMNPGVRCDVCSAEMGHAAHREHVASHTHPLALACPFADCKHNSAIYEDLEKHVEKKHIEYKSDATVSLRLLDQVLALRTLYARCFKHSGAGLKMLLIRPSILSSDKTFFFDLTREKLDAMLAEKGMRSVMRYDEKKQCLLKEEVETGTLFCQQAPSASPPDVEKTKSTRQQQHIVFSDSEEEDDMEVQQQEQDEEEEKHDFDAAGPLRLLLDGAPVVFDPKELVECATCRERVPKQYVSRRVHVSTKHLDIATRALPNAQFIPLADRAMRAAFVDLPYAETQCELCGFASPSMMEKTRHVRESHMNPAMICRDKTAVAEAVRLLFSGPRELTRVGVGPFLTTDVLTCSKCGLRLNRRDAREHLIEMHDEGWRCEAAAGCGVVCFSVRGINAHYEMAHPGMHLPDAAVLSKFDRHINDCLEKYFSDKSRVCGVCMHKQGSGFRGHIAAHAHPAALACPLCPHLGPIRNAYTFMKHVKDHQKASDDERRRLLDVCTAMRDLHQRCFPLTSFPFVPQFLSFLPTGRRLESRADVDSYLSEWGENSALRWDETEQMLLLNAAQTAQDGTSTSVKCCLCSARLTPSTLASHVPSHASENAFLCPLCPSNNSSKRSVERLLRHIQFNHANVRRCDALHLLDVYMGLRELHVKCFPELKPPSLPRIETIQEYDEQGEMTRKRLNELMSARLAKSVMNWDGNKKIMYRMKRKE